VNKNTRIVVCVGYALVIAGLFIGVSDNLLLFGKGGRLLTIGVGLLIFVVAFGIFWFIQEKTIRR
jgi:hypothetical protein